MTIKTIKYWFSHQKEPRGYGLWWFKIFYSVPDTARIAPVDVSYTGMYSTAKDSAIRYAVSVLKDPYAVIEVLP